MSNPAAEYNEDDYRAELIHAGLSPATEQMKNSNKKSVKY